MAPANKTPFSMPMFRQWVPKPIRPWIYVLFAVSFQISGGVYMGQAAQVYGGLSLMREDVSMCLYVTLAGMALYFPMLFRMKFRFTNKLLLMGAASLMALCNILVTVVHSVPTLWAICFFAGIAKIQGTFECISNIQLWMTSTRDMRAFFPIFHIILVGCMQFSDLITVHIAYYFNWHYMHYFVVGVMLTVCLGVLLLTRWIRLMPKVPLWGIDFTGAILWLLLSLQLIYIFNYGDWHDWYNSPEIVTMTGTALVTLGAAIHRMRYTLHAYYDIRIWKFKYMKEIFLLITLTELFFATETALETIYLGAGMHYDSLNDVSLDWAVLVGVLTAVCCGYYFLKIRRIGYYKMLIAGMAAQTLYLAGMYFLMDTNINIEKLYLPMAMRGFSYTLLSATYFICLFDAMNFATFFQAVSIFNIIHMTLGGVMGGALYSFGLRYYMRDNIGRYSQYIDSVQQSIAPEQFSSWYNSFIQNVQLISLKQIYGWVLYASVAVLVLYLLYDRPAVRYTVQRLPYWREFGLKVSHSVRHLPAKFR